MRLLKLSGRSLKVAGAHSKWVEPTKMSGAHSNFDFSPLMANKIGLSLNFGANQLNKEISDSKSYPYI